MKIAKIEKKVMSFYEELNRDQNGFLIIPEQWKQIAVLLIALLTFIKIFVSDKVDLILDEIIEALEKIIT
jgi:hypothetical protein